MSDYIFWDEMWNQSEKHRQERLHYPGTSPASTQENDSERSRIG